MAWLNLQLPLHEELEVEKQVWAIRDCDDLERVKELAVQMLRAWASQADITSQLIQQLADAEAMLFEAGLGEPVDEEYLEWARSLYPDDCRSGHI